MEDNSITTDLIKLTDRKVNVQEAIEFIGEPSHGAVDLFIGKVRNVNNDRKVIKIKYDLHESLTYQVLKEICNTCQEIFNYELKIFLLHASGELLVNDISVLIAVSAIHRKEAFDGCRYIIEALKTQAPIWKKEYYDDGESEWVKGHALCQV